MNKAVFVDRDNTIAKDVPYCSKPEDFELYPGTGESIRKLSEAGFKIILITNQSGIARGYFTKDMLNRIHRKMQADLAKCQAHIDYIYYCPHHPSDKCRCRKPEPGLIFKAAKDHNIDIQSSYFIGDSIHDIKAGNTAHCITILVNRYAYSNEVLAENKVNPDYTVENFSEASKIVISRGG